MNAGEIAAGYRKLYGSVNFERIGLFECVRSAFDVRIAVYFGSAAHVTPSFVIPRVDYVDQSDESERFFSDPASVVAFINTKKRYPGPCSLRYFRLDYHSHRLDPPASYDCAFSIFAPGSLRAALASVRKNGVVVHLPMPSEPAQSDAPAGFVRAGEIRCVRRQYSFNEAPTPGRPRGGKRWNAEGFVDDNVYAVYRRR